MTTTTSAPTDVLADLDLERERSLAEQMLANLERLRGERLDPLDLPRTMTRRQENEYRAYTAKLDGLLLGIPSPLQLIARDVARRAPLLVSLGPMRKAEAAIDAMIGDAPAKDAAPAMPPGGGMGGMGF